MRVKDTKGQTDEETERFKDRKAERCRDIEIQ